ncbi:NYN domain-containing protein [Mesorhizobium sp. M1217]
MTRYAFVDGANFRLMIDATRGYFGIPQAAGFDFERFFQDKFSADRVFYYDAIPAQKSGQSDAEHALEVERVEALFQKINSCGGVHVKTGVARHRRKRGMEQKGVDILLALDAYRHAVGGLDTVVLFTGDGDFYPVLEALQNTHARTILFCSRLYAPSYLTEMADFVEHVNEATFASFFEASPEFNPSALGVMNGGLSSYTVITQKKLRKVNSLQISGEIVEIWEREDSPYVYAIRVEKGFSFVAAADDKTLVKLLENQLGFTEATHGRIRT